MAAAQADRWLRQKQSRQQLGRDPDDGHWTLSKGCFNAAEPYTENEQFYNGFKHPTTDLKLFNTIFLRSN